MTSKRKRKIYRKLASRLDRKSLAVVAAKHGGRGGKHSWRDNLASSGAASPIRVIIKNGERVDG